MGRSSKLLDEYLGDSIPLSRNKKVLVLSKFLGMIYGLYMGNRTLLWPQDSD